MTLGKIKLLQCHNVWTYLIHTFIRVIVNFVVRTLFKERWIYCVFKNDKRGVRVNSVTFLKPIIQEWKGLEKICPLLCLLLDMHHHAPGNQPITDRGRDWRQQSFLVPSGHAQRAPAASRWLVILVFRSRNHGGINNNNNNKKYPSFVCLQLGIRKANRRRAKKRPKLSRRNWTGPEANNMLPFRAGGTSEDSQATRN